jgi:uncharacterized lipoprotein YmbA
MTMRNFHAVPAAAALALALLSGACSLGRDSPALQQYVLGRADVATPDAAPASGLMLGVRRLDLAAYLASPAIVVRRGAHEITTSDFHRWGEDPGAGINRAVARHLIAAGDVRGVDVAPWAARAQHDYLVQLHVTRFEGVLPQDVSATVGEAHVQATWEIIRPADGSVFARGSTDYREPGWRAGDYAGLVALLDAGLRMVARDVAAQLLPVDAP